MNAYKQTALDALRGNWKTAMLTGFVASLFGANTIYSGGGGGRSSSDDSGLSQDIVSYFHSPEGQQIFAVAIGILAAALLLLIVSLFIGGAMRLGYAKFNLHLIDREPAAFRDLFTYMDCKWKGFCMNFLTGLYIALWSLLLVIPGIVKSYAYAMTPFILSENPELSANEAITASKEMMDGRKWDLFCLYLSFIGWTLLASVPGLAVVVWGVYRGVQGIGGIGPMLGSIVIALVLLTVCYIPLQPYMEAANAAFYRELSPKPRESSDEWYLPQ